MSPAAVPQAEGAQSGGGWQWSEAARRGPAGDLGDHHRDQRRRTGSYNVCQGNQALARCGGHLGPYTTRNVIKVLERVVNG